MTDTKTPKPGEWWVSDSGLVAHVVGLTLDGEPAWQQKNSRQIWLDEIGFFLACFHYEPRCDSFDWVEPEPEPEPEQAEWSDMAAIQNMDLRRSEMASGGRISWAENQAIIQVIDIARRVIQPVETWPKYYVGKNWSDGDAYVRVDDTEAEFIWVSADGIERVFKGNRYASIPLCVSEHSWREVTAAEALARVKPVAIDPGDGWEILPDETMREINDELTDDGGANWQKTNSSGTPIPHDSPYVYRRRIQPVHTTIDVNPGDGYRWLGPEEFVEGTDEVFRPDLNPMWIPPLTRAGYMCCDDDYPVRRRIEPVESPDDWVEITNRDHKLRAGIDEFRNSHEWAYVRDAHGKTARQAGFLNVRCRRKDLPVLVTCTCPTLDGIPVTGSACPIHGLPSCELTTAAKRVPVRLWINGDDGVVFQSEVHVNADDQEIKHDADGFYVEGGER